MSSTVVKFTDIKDRQYFDELNHIVDAVYEEACTVREWSYDELAGRSGVSLGTIYRLGSRCTMYPRFSTVWKLVRAVGGRLQLQLSRVRTRQEAAQS